MPEEIDRQIQLRETGGRLGRRSDLARRGMNAFNYVSGLSTRQKPDLNQVSTATEYSFEFLRKWGGTPVENNATFDLHTEAKDGEFLHPDALALDREGNVYVADSVNYIRPNHRVQVFKPVISIPAP